MLNLVTLNGGLTVLHSCSNEPNSPVPQAHDTAVRAMRWSHSDAWMVTADHAGYIKYWQSNMNNVKMYQGHKEPIRGIR